MPTHNSSRPARGPVRCMHGRHTLKGGGPGISKGKRAERPAGPPQIITHTEGIRQATIWIAPSTLPRGQTQCPRDHPRYLTRSSSKFGLLVTH